MRWVFIFLLLALFLFITLYHYMNTKIPTRENPYRVYNPNIPGVRDFLEVFGVHLESDKDRYSFSKKDFGLRDLMDLQSYQENPRLAEEIAKQKLRNEVGRFERNEFRGELGEHYKNLDSIGAFGDRMDHRIEFEKKMFNHR